MFPLPPLIYLSLTGWTLYFVVANRPMEVIFSAAIVLSGIIFYFISEKKLIIQTNQFGGIRRD